MTKVKTCSPCRPHPYQDAKYGDRQRVHNSKKPSTNSPLEWRCTVCGTERT